MLSLLSLSDVYHQQHCCFTAASTAARRAGIAIGTAAVTRSVEATAVHVNAHLIEGLCLDKVHLLVDGVGVVLADHGNDGGTAVVVVVGIGHAGVVVVVVTGGGVAVAAECIQTTAGWNVPSGRLTVADIVD